MFRAYPYRRLCPQTILERIDQAQTQQFFIVQECGPLAFILKDGSNTNNKVCLGFTQSCSCGVFTNEKDICVHLLWVMMRVFRVQVGNEMLFQKSLVEREIAELMSGRRSRKSICGGHSNRVGEDETTDSAHGDTCTKIPNEMDTCCHVPQREIKPDDICPICMDSLVTDDDAPLSYCKRSCGNSIHLKCLKVLMEHQTKNLGLEMLKCPLCRNDYGSSMDALRQEIEVGMNANKNNTKRTVRAERKCLHLGYKCRGCFTCPITGNCHRCVVCKDYHLCDECFNNGMHSIHCFENRSSMKTAQWVPSERCVDPTLPTAMVQDLQTRELTDADYELLRTLDAAKVQQGLTPLHVINTFPLKKLSVMDNDIARMGSTCRVCVSAVRVGDLMRKIPCGCWYHRECIDRWLLHSRSNCPSCGLAAYGLVNEEDGGMNDGEGVDLNSAKYVAKQYEEKEKKLKKKTAKVEAVRQETKVNKRGGVGLLLGKNAFNTTQSLDDMVVLGSRQSGSILSATSSSATLFEAETNSHSSPTQQIRTKIAKKNASLKSMNAKNDANLDLCIESLQIGTRTEPVVVTNSTDKPKLSRNTKTSSNNLGKKITPPKKTVPNNGLELVVAPLHLTR